MKGRLRDAALTQPEVSFTDQEPVAQHRSQPLVAGDIAAVLLGVGEHVLDVPGRVKGRPSRRPSAALPPRQAGPFRSRDAADRARSQARPEQAAGRRTGRHLGPDETDAADIRTTSALSVPRGLRPQASAIAHGTGASFATRSRVL